MFDNAPPNVLMPTLGGRQFWGDVCHFRGWRIQQNVYTGHYRLLDPRDVRHAWGTCEHCRSRLEAIRREQNLLPLSGRAVILAHGIVRSSKSFSRMRERLEREGCLVIPFDYPSTRLPITESAKYLRRVIDSLEGVEQIDFVVHSMGGLIVRAYVGLTRDQPDPRLHRMVMIGVPNLGARLAGLLRDQMLFRAIFGPSGQQLVDDPEGFIARLPTPAFEFAVIAGSRGSPQGYNPLIPGDDDAVVSVDATRLPGAADFLLVPGIHSLLLSNAEVIAATQRFLTSGSLHADGTKEPIPRPSPPMAADAARP